MPEIGVPAHEFVTRAAPCQFRCRRSDSGRVAITGELDEVMWLVELIGLDRELEFVDEPVSPVAA